MKKMASPAISNNSLRQSQNSGTRQSQLSGTAQLQLPGTEQSQHSRSRQSQHSVSRQSQLSGKGQIQHSGSRQSHHSVSRQSQLSGKGQIQHSGSRQSQHSVSRQSQHSGSRQSQHSVSRQSQHSGTAQLQLPGTEQSQHSVLRQSQLSGKGQIQYSGSRQSQHSGSRQSQHSGSGQLQFPGTGQSQHSGSRNSQHSASEKLQNSGSGIVCHTAISILSSVLRQVSHIIQDREIQEAHSSLQNTLSLHSVPNSDMTVLAGDSLVKFAAELVDEMVTKALLILDKRDEEYMIMTSKMYPNTKEAIDSHPSIFEIANEFIDTVLNQTRSRVDHMKLLGIEKFQNYSSADDFKVKDGLEIIVKCISKWMFNPHWYFEIIYNGKLISDSLPDSQSYYYTVRWSVPSLSYPIAQVTVDIYFLIEVFNMTPPPVHIQVGYRLETDRSLRCALTNPFLEKWLNTTVKRKLEAFKLFKF